MSPDHFNRRRCRDATPRATGRARRRAAAASLALLAGGCATATAPRTVSLRALEAAPACRPPGAQRAFVADIEELRPLCRPLTSCLGLVQVHSVEQWRRLRRAALLPVDDPPDFSRGSVVGLVAYCGAPTDARWPAAIESLRLHGAAGLLTARAENGCFLADGTSYLEWAYVPGLSAVLVVDVENLRFFVD